MFKASLRGKLGDGPTEEPPGDILEQCKRDDQDDDDGDDDDDDDDDGKYGKYGCGCPTRC